MQKVLLLDTNVSSTPIYHFLLESGYYVVVVGGNPLDTLAKIAKNYIRMDYSNLDEISELVERLDIDFIVPGCNDLSYEVASKLNFNKKFFGIEAIDTTEIINNKKKFRSFAEQINLPIPKVFKVGETVDISWPVIVKPVDAYSGRGVTIVWEENLLNLREAIKKAIEFSSSKNYIIEQYVEGQLYSHSAFLSNGEILIDFFVEEHGTANPFVVDTSKVVYDFPEKSKVLIRELITKTSKNLSLIDGLIHTQFIERNDQIWLIEVTRRCPGDLYSKLIEMSTEFPYSENYVRPFLNKNFRLPNKSYTEKHLIRHTISLQNHKNYIELKFKLPVLIGSFIPLSLAGDSIKPSPFSRIALVFIKCNSNEELVTIYERILKRELYLVD